MNRQLPREGARSQDRERTQEKPRLNPLEHGAYFAVCFALVLLFAAAAWLDPDPSGLGTHTQLHLPPCGFYEIFHKPCPSCGMTTAFAWMMHGHPFRAVKAQPAGAAVFLAAALLLAYLPLAWRAGKAPAELLEARAFLPTVVGLIALILTVWAYRVLH